MKDQITIRVAIPSFFAEKTNGTGYGSGRPGQKLAREIALARCLTSLLSQRRTLEDAVLHIGERSIHHWDAKPNRLEQTLRLELEIHVFTDGKNRLNKVLDLFKDSIHVHNIELENPRHLPLEARDWLIKYDPITDLSVYMEDDIIINDPLFFDKQFWFLERTSNKFVLMPHRVETVLSGRTSRLIVDGPLASSFINKFCEPKSYIAAGRFDPLGEEISFDITENPHSGCFIISREQVKHLRKQILPRDGFVTTLETAATLTVLKYYNVLKPSKGKQRFLEIIHGHPSFLSYLNTFPQK